MKITKKIFSIILMGCVFFSCQKNTSKTNKPEYNNALSLSWGNVINLPEKQVFTSDFILKNNSDSLWKNKNWVIYFNLVREIVKIPPQVIIKHINGDFYKMIPSDTFKGIGGHDSLVIPLTVKFWAVSFSDAPSRPFIVYKDANGNIFRKENLRYNILAFDHLKLKRTKNDNMPVADALWHYNRNEKLTDVPKEKLPKIIPSPLLYHENKNTTNINRNIPIYYVNHDFENEAIKMAEMLNSDNGFSSKTAAINKVGNARGIYLLKDHQAKNNEAYTLTIKDGQVIIKAAENAGIFYATQSFQALLPIDNKAKIILKQTKIKDRPRFVYRGMLLDVARNFQSKAMVKQLIKQMAFYKLNTLHFHLTDDEGWRLEIPSLPELTQIGARRDFQSEKAMLPSFGSGFEKKSPGSGYYSKKDFVEILKYAQKHHIEIIPEIDMPGHARAAIMAMKHRYDRLMKSGKEQEAKKYLLSDPNDKSEYRSVQLWDDGVINPCMESVYTFFNEVTEEIMKMYEEAGVKLKTIHTGGDEVPDGVWEKSPLCGRVKGNKKSIISQLFINRIVQLLKSKGLKTAGWEEIALKKIDDTFVINNQLSKENIHPYIWNNLWGGALQDISYRLANAGYDVVLSNATNLYFDLAYEKNPEEIGSYWAGYVNTKKAYEFTPDNIKLSAYNDRFGNEVSQKSLETFTLLTEKGKKHIMGIQGQLWGENARSRSAAEYSIYPKLIALAERAWATQPVWATIPTKEKRIKALNTHWNTFANQLAKNELPRLSKNKINYRVPPVGLKVIKDKLYANTAFPGLNIYYSSDGKIPNEKATRYTAPLHFDKDKIYCFRVEGGKNNWSRPTYLVDP